MDYSHNFGDIIFVCEIKNVVFVLPVRHHDKETKLFLSSKVFSILTQMKKKLIYKGVQLVRLV